MQSVAFYALKTTWSGPVEMTEGADCSSSGLWWAKSIVSVSLEKVASNWSGRVSAVS